MLIPLFVACALQQPEGGAPDPRVQGTESDVPGCSPGAEACDGIDNDCDGEVDEAPIDGSFFWVDEDGDGFGNDALEVWACTVPSGHAAIGGDCDDASSARYPGAPEVCDGLDNDCDAVVDDDPVDGATVHADTDGDGHAGTSTEITCTPPTELPAPDDCDDDDPAIHPLAEESCGDAIDQDCTGRPDNGCEVMGLDDADWVLEGAAGTDLGASLDTFVDVDGRSSVVTSSTDLDGDPWTSTLYLLNGVQGSATDAGADAIVTITDGGEVLFEGGERGADLNHDGTPDLMARGVAVPGGTFQPTWFFGPLASTMTVQDADVRWKQETCVELPTASATGDVSGDGYEDLAFSADTDLGSWTDCVAPSPHGVVLLYTDLPDGFDAEGATATLTSIESKTGFGRALAMEDATGDGVADLVVGAPFASLESPAHGRVFLFDGPVDGALTNADALVTLEGTEAVDGLGSALVWGDMDDDGHADLVVSASLGDSVSGKGDTYADGLIAVFPGPLTGKLTELDAMARIHADDDVSRLGASLTVGDLDGDGRADLLATDPMAGAGDGRVYGYYGPLLGARWASAADLTIGGDSSSKPLADAVLVDLDGNGGVDIVAGHPDGDLPGVSTFYGPFF